MKTHRRTWLLSLAGMALASHPLHALAQEAVVKIAHVAPVTGPIAYLGKDNKNGSRLAVEDLNANGLTTGGKKARFELPAEDDGADPRCAVEVANKLVTAKVAAVIGHLNSGANIPASRI